MNIVKRFFVLITALVGMFLISTNAFAKNYVMKIAFVGSPNLRTTIIRKIFGNIDTSLKGGIRKATPNDSVLCRFSETDFNENSPSANESIVFMIVDFADGKSFDDQTEFIDDWFYKIRHGRKVILVGVNLPESKHYDMVLYLENYKRAQNSRDNNFDFMLTTQNVNNETFRNDFFEVSDKMVNWRELPPTSIDDVTLLHTLDPVEKSMSRLDDMVGLNEVKDLLRSLIVSVRQEKLDRECGLTSAVTPFYHMIITGNPGTGKTTLARRLSTMFYEAGIIPKNKFIQVERKDLVDKYIGGTEEKVKEMIKSAEGGVLFIDEAYSLVGEGKDYGRHVIEGMLSAMTDNTCTVVAAGYPDKMRNFLDTNDGLARRFTYHVNLPDYDREQMLNIFVRLCRKNNFIFEENEAAMRIISEYFEQRRMLPGFGNAGEAENFFRDVKTTRACRLEESKSTAREERQYIKTDDLRNAISLRQRLAGNPQN